MKRVGAKAHFRSEMNDNPDVFQRCRRREWAARGVWVSGGAGLLFAGGARRSSALAVVSIPAVAQGISRRPAASVRVPAREGTLRFAVGDAQAKGETKPGFARFSRKTGAGKL
jgi:hypothetical protein